VVKRPADLRSLARAYTQKGVDVLGGYVNSDNIDPEIKLRAIKMLWERGWGTPPQTHEHTGKDGDSEIRVILRTIVEGKK
jgi:hypothetical protein